MAKSRSVEGGFSHIFPSVPLFLYDQELAVIES